MIGLSEDAQVGTGSPPWYLLSDRWSVRSKGILILAVFDESFPMIPRNPDSVKWW
jgi:hypothetical protein